MNTRPPDLADDEVAHALREHWDFEPVHLDYAAVGFGSHHWIAVDAAGTRRFVTVDLRDFNALERAFTVAARLRHLPYVCAPIEPVLRSIKPGFSMAVFPWIDGRTYPYDDFPSDDERDRALEMVAALHSQTGTVAGVAPREDFALRHRAELEAALDDLDSVWDFGPYSEPCRRILATAPRHIRDSLAAYDDFARGAVGAEFVITHGEPHAANIIDTDAGFVLVDWDTAKLAPRERDVARIVGDASDADAYGGDVDADRLLMYHLWWNLAEIAVYTAEFRSPHVDSDDTRESLKNLEYFANLGEQYPGLLD